MGPPGAPFRLGLGENPPPPPLLWAALVVISPKEIDWKFVTAFLSNE